MSRNVRGYNSIGRARQWQGLSIYQIVLANHHMNRPGQPVSLIA